MKENCDFKTPYLGLPFEENWRKVYGMYTSIITTKYYPDIFLQ